SVPGQLAADGRRRRRFVLGRPPATQPAVLVPIGLFGSGQSPPLCRAAKTAPHIPGAVGHNAQYDYQLRRWWERQEPDEQDHEPARDPGLDREHKPEPTHTD